MVFSRYLLHFCSQITGSSGQPDLLWSTNATSGNCRPYVTQARATPGIALHRAMRLHNVVVHNPKHIVGLRQPKHSQSSEIKIWPTPNRAGHKLVTK